MKIKRIVSFITFLCMVICMLPCTSVFALENNNAYIDFSANESKYISTTDGESITDTAHPLYYETVTADGTSGRKISGSNSIFLKIDTNNFNPTKAAVVITYYDDASVESDFYVCYKNKNVTKKLKVRKAGTKSRWVTTSVFIDDIVFDGGLDYNSDIVITTMSTDIFSKIEVVDLSDSGMYVAKNITPTTVTDSRSGRTWQHMNLNGNPAIRPYVTAQSFNGEGTKFIFKSYYMSQAGSVNSSVYAMYEYDIYNGRAIFMDNNVETDAGTMSAVVTPSEVIYYGKADGFTWKMNWLTYQKEKTKAASYGVINATNDGEWVSGYGGEKNYVYRSNTVTGEVNTVNIDSAYANWTGNSHSSGKGHPMINPVYPDLFFFCHEGSTEYIPDRLWQANFATGDVYNMFVQVPYSSTVTAETSGHEIWSDDGEMMYWIKYTYGRNKGQSGMMRMDKFGSNREYINHDYNFWHCFPSSDHNFVVGDTNTATSNVAIVSTNTYKSWLIATFPVGWSHPNQPHPHISRNNYAVSWQVVHNGVTSIGWNTVRDITLNPKEKQIIPFGEDANIITCEGAVSETTLEAVDGIAYRKAASGKGIYVDILNTVAKSSNINVTVDFKYLDKGTNPIKIVCTAGVDAIGNLADRENKTKTVAKTNSGEQKQVSVDLGSINANDIGKFMSDLYFTTDGEDTYISDINVHATVVSGDAMYVTEKIYSVSDSEGDDQSGLCCTATHNMETYNNILYHVDDVEGWKAGGISEATVASAKSNGNSYVTYRYDGAWMYKNYTDANGETRTAFYAPKNYREIKMGGHQVNGNIYFRLLDDTITSDDKEVTITVDYVDLSGITVTYISTKGMSSFTIPGGNTKKWKSTSVTVYDAALSSINADTKLASGVDDIKLASNGNEMYVSGVTVSKKTVHNVPFASLSRGDTYYQRDNALGVIPCADVTNNGNAEGFARVIHVTYDELEEICDISMSALTTVEPGKTVTVNAPVFTRDSSKSYRTFVWQDSLKPINKAEEPITIRVDGSDNGMLVSFGQMPDYSDVFYNVFCDGKLMARTKKYGTVTLKDIQEIGHTYFVDVTDNLGKTLYRTKPIEY